MTAEDQVIIEMIIIRRAQRPFEIAWAGAGAGGLVGNLFEGNLKLRSGVLHLSVFQNFAIIANLILSISLTYLVRSAISYYMVFRLLKST